MLSLNVCKAIGEVSAKETVANPTTDRIGLIYVVAPKEQRQLQSLPTFRKKIRITRCVSTIVRCILIFHLKMSSQD